MTNTMDHAEIPELQKVIGLGETHETEGAETSETATKTVDVAAPTAGATPVPV